MLLKVIIVLLLLALVASLISGLVFLLIDAGTTKRTLHSLGVRVVLAIALMATISYGFFSGKLEVGAPWDAGRYGPLQSPAASQGITPLSEDIDEEKQTDPNDIDKVPVP